MYESFQDVHSMPGLVLTNPAPTAADDVTTVPPVVGELRCDGSAMYACSAASYDMVNGTWTVTWGRITFGGFA